MHPQQTNSNVTDGLPVPQRYWAVLAVSLGVLLAVLDGAIANVALPAIARNFSATPAASIGVITAYQIVIAVCLLPLASFADLVGYRRVYLCGLALFTLASLGCALSHTLVALTLLRIVQGLGAAGIMSVNSALIRFIFPQAKLGRGISINATVVAASSVLGPTIASAILSVANWPWLFAVNIPVGILALSVGYRALPHTPLSVRRYDGVSALLNVLTFGLFLVGMDGIGHEHHGLLVGCELVAAIVIGTFFVKRQLHQRAPLLPVDLLRIPTFALSVGTSLCSFIAQMMAFVSLPFFMQGALGRSQVETGLLMTPWPMVIVVVAPISGWLSDRYRAGVLGSAGLALMCAGLLALALLSGHPSNFDIVWRMGLCGAGFGLFQSPNNRAMLTSAPPERSGGASGMLSTTRLCGQTMGAASVAIVFTFGGVHGTTVTLVLAAVFAALGAVASSLRLLPAKGGASGDPATAP